MTDTAALVETVRDALTRWVYPEQSAIDPEVQRNLAALDALAQRLADVTEKWVHMSNRYMEVYIEKERAEEALRAWLEWYDSGYRGHQPAKLALDSRAALTPTEKKGT